METNSPWPSAMRYGLALSFAQIIIHLVFFLINPESVQKTWSTLNMVQMLFTAIVSIYIFYYATLQWRNSELSGTISYNHSLGYMIKMALPAAFVLSVYTLVFMRYINADAMNQAMEMQAQAMYDKGMSEEQIEQSMQMAKKFTSPAVMLIFGIIGSMIISIIYALIASIFTKKNPVTDNN